MSDEKIMWFFCACSEWHDDPGMVVCWKCEQPVVDVQDTSALNGVAMQNLLGLCVRYRGALEKIVSDSRRSELADAEYLRGIALGVIERPLS